MALPWSCAQQAETTQLEDVVVSASHIEVLRGPMAQLYDNAGGGVVQVFTRDPPMAPAPAFGALFVGAGSDNQRQLGVSVGGGTETLGALLDVSHYSTDDRIDNLFDRIYAGSVIVNSGNGHFFEPAPSRRFSSDCAACFSAGRRKQQSKIGARLE